MACNIDRPLKPEGHLVIAKGAHDNVTEELFAVALLLCRLQPCRVKVSICVPQRRRSARMAASPDSHSRVLQGKETLTSGDFYEGDWEKGRKHGKVRRVSASSTHEVALSWAVVIVGHGDILYLSEPYVSCRALLGHSRQQG